MRYLLSPPAQLFRLRGPLAPTVRGKAVCVVQFVGLSAAIGDPALFSGLVAAGEIAALALVPG
jgi:hypothetical protein